MEHLKIKALHLKSKIGKLENIINPNHRHDEESEKITDAKRTKVAQGHRFESFAPEREGNRIKWFIDGRDYFWAVSVALERAKETIYIEDWWLSPELFLRRPPYYTRDWRLDQVLKRRAEAGVQIYVVVYKEVYSIAALSKATLTVLKVESFVSCNSTHTKNALRALCPKGSPGYGNIHVMRHPDHNVFENMGDMTFYWAHHEKFIVIDYNIAFIGGLDLCFGRWDSHQHPLADVCPDGIENAIFPGQDYNNNRAMDFQNVADWKNNQLSKAEYGRMPWHDVSMGVIGPCVYDIAEHFVLRWNFCKRDKYKRDERFDYLILEGRDGPAEDLVAVQRPNHPVGEYLQHPLSPLSTKLLTPDQGTVNAQILRSSADWSSGILVEHSIQNAYKELIRKAEHIVYIENQFFITATGEHQAPIINTVGEAIVEACVRAGKEGRKFRVIILIPAIPGFAGDLRSNAAVGTRAIMDYQYISIHRGEHSIMERIKAQGVDPTKHIFFFNLRSYDRINKTPAMKEMEERSGVTYQEVQRAHAEEIMSSAVHSRDHVNSAKAKLRHPLHEKEDREQGQRDKHADAARDKLMERKRLFEAEREHVGLNKFNDIDGDRLADSVDSIAKDAMLGEPKVSEEIWNKDEPEQERENFVQEELYIHDKVMIVDDRFAICGSANINDRSQLGYHDSEIAIVMEDTNVIDSFMDGRPYKAGRHVASLRRMLWREHLGLLPAQQLEAEKDPNAQHPGDCDNTFHADDKWNDFVADPLHDELWDMWTRQATTNTQVFRDLFHADPDDAIKTFDDYGDFLPLSSRQGHLRDLDMSVAQIKKELDKIRGHLVWMPLDFLCNATMAEKGTMSLNAYTESIYT